MAREEIVQPVEEHQEPGYVDAHLHLQDRRLSDQLASVAARAAKRGVIRLFCNATHEEDWFAVLEVQQRVSGVVPFIGVHPWFAEMVSAGWGERLQELLAHNSCGVGEVGLDKKCRVGVEQQINVFTLQVELALEFRRPLVIHCVKSWDNLFSVLEPRYKKQDAPPLMLHSFVGSMEVMERLMRLGAYVSFSTGLQQPGQEKLRRVFQQVPLERILLETDAPNRATGAHDQGCAARSSEPMDVADLYTEAAQLKNIDISVVKSVVWNNGKVFTDAAAAGR